MGFTAKEQSMATKADFSDDVWAQISTLPMNVMIAAAAAQSDGSGDSNREVLAGMGELAQAEKAHAGNELIQAVLADLKVQEAEGKIDHEVTLSTDQAAAFTQQTLAAAAVAVEAISKVATEQEAAEFAGWIHDIAEQTVLAAKSGGFLGMGGDEVSEPEQSFIVQLERRLDAMY
jgi:hypothetical protein